LATPDLPPLATIALRTHPTGRPRPRRTRWAAGQLHALKQIICHLLAHHYRDVIAYGAGWTDQERQQPVGDTGRHEPRHIDAILEPNCNERSRTPTRSAASRSSPPAEQPHSCCSPTPSPAPKRSAQNEPPASSPTHSPAGTARSAPPVWEFLRPMLSPTLAALNRDAFIADHSVETTVDLDRHRSASNLDEIELDNPHASEAA
jgi:hypothetical protein